MKSYTSRQRYTRYTICITIPTISLSVQTLHAAAACSEFQFSREETETATVICIELEINLPLTTGMCNRIFSEYNMELEGKVSNLHFKAYFWRKNESSRGADVKF